MQRIAMISDVHGNLTALHAVLADIERRGITRIFNLGDYVGKGPRGREAVEVCQERCEVNILGNWDDFLPNPTAEDLANDALSWWREQLAPGQGEWLRGLPFKHDLWVSGRRIRLFHACEETVHRRVRFVKTQAEFEGLFDNSAATGPFAPDGQIVDPELAPDVIGYGDTHDPFYETQLAGRTVFNTGAVGNCMGDPTPVYCIVEGEVGSPKIGGWSVSFVRVPYDVEAELAYARKVGVPFYEGYELELRHGLYRGILDRWRHGETLTDYHERRPKK